MIMYTQFQIKTIFQTLKFLANSLTFPALPQIFHDKNGHNEFKQRNDSNAFLYITVFESNKNKIIISLS